MTGFSPRLLFIQVLLKNEAPGMHNEAATIRFKRCWEKILLKIFAWMSGRFNGNKQKNQQQHVHERYFYSGDLSQASSAVG